MNTESKWEPRGAFYLVDLPGVGFAKVPRHIRQQWLGFMRQYIYERATLRVVFHLVDSRLGPVEQDEAVMALMAGAPPTVTYVIVLTKADKRESPRVLRDTLTSIEAKLVAAGCSKDVPVLLTSSENRLGRDHMWRYLRLAADPGAFRR